MSYNGSGVYTLPGAALANGDIVSATENNQFRNDVAAALNVAWTRDGQAPATANIPMGSHKLTGLAAGTGVGDSVRFEQLPSPTNLLPVASGGTGSGTASGARTNLGLVIGTDVQAYSAELQGATQGGINGMKNRIINGAMMIDQRNAGASVTVTTAEEFITDRWQFAPSASSKLTAQQSSTAPAGFANSLLLTSSAATSVGSGDYYFLQQKIEGFNFADCGWGTASASTVTVSFWCRSSVTGTYGGALVNSAQNRSYPFSYSISAANTWEYKTITVAGDTTGTWIGATNGTGVRLRLGFGIGSTYSGTSGSWAAANYMAPTGATNWISTSGATFYITGVQLEKGSTATSFDYRPYGTELALCQRYLPAFTTANGVRDYIASGIVRTSTTATMALKFPVATRVPPTGLVTNATAANGYAGVDGGGGGNDRSNLVPTFNQAGTSGTNLLLVNASAGFSPSGEAAQGWIQNGCYIYFTGCEL